MQKLAQELNKDGSGAGNPLNKLAELCEVMEVHPLTLLTLAYAGKSQKQAEQLLAQVRRELEAVAKEGSVP